MTTFAILVLVAVTLVEGYAPNLDFSSQIIEATKAGDYAKAQALLSLQSQVRGSNPVSEQSSAPVNIQSGGVPVSGQVTLTDTASLPGQVSVQFASSSSSHEAATKLVSSQGPISGQVPFPGQVSLPGQVPTSGQISTSILPGASAPNVDSKYFSTSSNSKSQAVYTSGDVENNPHLSQIKNLADAKVTPEGVKNLQPIPGGKVFGEAQKTYYTWTTVNGKTTVQSHGHKVINDNGKIVEYEFKPEINKDQLVNGQGLAQTNQVDIIKNLKPIPGGHVYGEAENNFQASANVNGQSFEKAGGYKVVNDDGKVSEFSLQPIKKP
ncbi:hypothetical protein K1T71_002080 [Dendrolimus kikuchii]|uniref:Uncharacterized protein n=1 Tax=Dendrolimus kikuchii TaxID=765133 RepID=A0ACC1DFR4_9NEOP|nr:hypothetical protein K1T71_002080 [Dendrolimus kikuchii]